MSMKIDTSIDSYKSVQYKGRIKDGAFFQKKKKVEMLFLRSTVCAFS
jgi:hypothetical protein